MFNIRNGVTRNTICSSQYVCYSTRKKFSSYINHIFGCKFCAVMLITVPFFAHRNAMKLVFLLGNPLEIFKSIVGFHTVDVVDFKRKVLIRQEGFRDKTVNSWIPSLPISLQHDLQVTDASYPRFNNTCWSCPSGAIFTATSSNVPVRTNFIPIIERGTRMLFPYLCHISMLTKTIEAIKT